VVQPPPPPPPPPTNEQILIANVTNDKNSPYLGVLDREGLDALIDQGLGRLLGRLKVSPVLQRGQFQGFRVTGVDPAWKSAGIAVDDVILRLNGQPIERPEQAQAAFESLRVASEISLDLTREGKPKKLRYRIESR
jgi:S1-C subfamily serine protease